MILVLQATLSLVLGVVFLVAAIPKLRNPGRFSLTVIQYRVLSARRSVIYARALPVAELALALFLLTGVLVAVACALALLLLATFVVALGVNLLRDRDVPCGCFGAGGASSGSSGAGTGPPAGRGCSCRHHTFFTAGTARSLVSVQSSRGWP